MPQKTQQDDPSAKSVKVQRQQADLDLVNHVYGGTMAMRSAGEKYLPPAPKENRQRWENRMTRSYLYPAYGRTVDGSTAAAFRDDPVLGKETPERTVEQWANLDLAGTSGADFVRAVFGKGLNEGHCSWLIDMADTNGQTLSALEEQRIRPYWTMVPKSALLRFNTFVDEDGATKLNSVAWHETAIRKTGDFTDEEVERVRQYDLIELPADAVRELGQIIREDEVDAAGNVRRVQWRLWELEKKQNGQEEWVEPDPGFKMMGNRRHIPFYTFYGIKEDVLVSRPPFKGLAELNVQHWQVQSDNATLEWVAKVPIWIQTGEAAAETEIAISVGAGYHLPGDSDAKFVQADASAVGIGRQTLKDIEAQMGAVGVSILERQTAQRETATARQLERSEKDGGLLNWVQSMEARVTQALQEHAEWDGVENWEDVSISFNRDFVRQILTAAEIASRLAMREAKTITLDTLWEMLESGGVLPEGFDPDAEKIALEQEQSEQEEQDMARLARALEQVEPGQAEPPEPPEE